MLTKKRVGNYILEQFTNLRKYHDRIDIMLEKTHLHVVHKVHFSSVGPFRDTSAAYFSTSPRRCGAKECKWNTLPETNVAPKNRPPQKESSIPTIHFRCYVFSFREGKLNDDLEIKGLRNSSRTKIIFHFMKFMKGHES